MNSAISLWNLAYENRPISYLFPLKDIIDWEVENLLNFYLDNLKQGSKKEIREVLEMIIIAKIHGWMHIHTYTQAKNCHVFWNENIAVRNFDVLKVKILNEENRDQV